MRARKAALSGGVVALAAFLLCAGGADAAGGGRADMPEHSVMAGAETHPPLRLTPGRPGIVRLDAPVGDISVSGTRKQLTAFAYGAKTVALFPGKAGAAHITIRGRDGAPLMSRYVLVAENGSRYIRVRQTCQKKAAQDGCGAVRVYYCTNVCNETHIVEVPQAALP